MREPTAISFRARAADEAKKAGAVQLAGVEIPAHILNLFASTTLAIQAGVSVRTAALLATAACETVGELPLEWRKAADEACAAAAENVPDTVPPDWD